ncbi:DNA damage-binding protein 1, partial [Fragariocoptes setiger]
MAYNYVVTAHRASAVSQCVTGNFTGPDDLNLIVAKTSRLEISKVTPDGLRLIKEVGIYGRLASIKLFRLPEEHKDLLFFLTCKYHVGILEFVLNDDDSVDVITRAHGNIADSSVRPCETGNIVIIDPLCKVIGLRLYDGLFKVIPIDHNIKVLRAFNVRMEEMVVPDICFLYGYNQPTIAFIYKEQTDMRHVKTYEINLRDKEFIKGPWGQDDVDSEANTIIPVPLPLGGVIIIAFESITYIKGDKYKAISPSLVRQAPIICYAPIDKDGGRYLLGDNLGRLFCLVLEKEDDTIPAEVKQLKLEFLGEISIPECLTYLDNYVVYVGSRLGDSQLIRLSTTPDESGSFITVLETYANLGPIADMCIVDLERQGQGQLVTCSGHSKDGSLRIIRNGIGINEHAAIDLATIKGLWPLKVGEKRIKDTHLVVTYVAITDLWLLQGEEVRSIEVSGFSHSQRTLYCGNVNGARLVQITATHVRLISATTMELLQSWSPPEGKQISVVSSNSTQIVCACRDTLYYIEIQESGLKLQSSSRQDHEVACIDISPLWSTHHSTKFCSVGFWMDISVRVFELPNFKMLHNEVLCSTTIPRSILVVTFEDIHYLLCALGDGSVFYFTLNGDSGSLSDRKKVTLGTQQTTLKTFRSLATTNVFACSDRPTVIYSSNHKLVFSNVNLKEVSHMCPLDSEMYPDSLALTNETSMLFGTIDEIQKLHIRTVPLHESPWKIKYQESTQTFGVLTMRQDYLEANTQQPMRPSASTQAPHKSLAANMTTTARPPGAVVEQNNQEVDVSNLLIINQYTFEVLHAHQFMPTEHATSILSSRLGDSTEEFFIVGTSFVNADEPEPRSGRLIVFKWSENKLQQIAETSVRGAPYCMCEFDRKFLVGVNASVHLIELNARGDLRVECTYVNTTLALHLRRKGDFIIMGDLMRSMSLFAYKPLESTFEEISRDYNPEWMTEVEILEDDIFLGAEHTFNMFVCKKDSSSANDQDRQVLEHIGKFHLGDSVNVFRHGSLVMVHPGENSAPITSSVLYGTVDGAIGLVAQIPEGFYRLLKDVQTKLAKVIKSVGKIDHADWRAFATTRSSQPAKNFIDGDLIESFLDLSRSKMEAVADGITIDDGSGMRREATVDDLVKTIEDLTRIH